MSLHWKSGEIKKNFFDLAHTCTWKFLPTKRIDFQQSWNRHARSIAAYCMHNQIGMQTSSLPPAKRLRVLPPLITKGASIMAEDARCIELHLRGKHLNSCDERSAGWEVLNLAAKHQVLHWVGNCFSDAANRKPVSTWPTLDSQGKMLCGGMRCFDFEHLFDTYRAYMDPCSQVRAMHLEDLSVMRLSDMARIIEQQIVPTLLARSENLQLEARMQQPQQQSISRY